MSLRVRLVLLTVALVALVAVALSGLYLNSLVNTLSAAVFDRTELASQQVNAFVIDRLNQRAKDYPAPADLEETKAQWHQIVETDPDIASTLERTMALSPALVEINVADASGKILASSNPLRVGKDLAFLQQFSVWRARPFYRQVSDLIFRRPDYQVSAPLGIAGQSDPIFTIQVVASSVLLRNAVLPEIEKLALISAAALLVSLFLTAFATTRVLRPLRRIEQTIDRIAQGQYAAEEPLSVVPREPKEFAAVASKLNLLGQQYFGARQDATKLKHSLDEMIERVASQLDVASRFAAISRISGGVAHEIKNPLNAIALRLDLLRARVDDSQAELIPEIDVLSKEVRRLDRVVKTFLDFSRPVEVRFADVNLGALTAEVASLMTPQAKLAGIEIQCDVPPEPALSKLMMRGDADMLKQALLNLVTNALEAMKKGGHIRLSVTRAGDSLTLEVADDGPGIPPELRDKVFQLYFTTKERGSGIGLAMTYRAVQLHNGTVDFTSEPDRGTTFRLQFPALTHHV